MNEAEREMGSDESIALYRHLIDDFLTVRSARDQREGYPAFEGPLISDGAGMLAERKLLVYLRAILCEWPEGAGVEAAPSLWFLVCRDRQVPGSFVGSFAVETELLIEALRDLNPSLGDLEIPLPAVEAKDTGVDRVVAGDPLYLQISYTLIAPVHGNREQRLPAAGIRFAVSGDEEEREHPTAYSFGMVGLAPLLALDAALTRYSGPSSFVLELEELGQEIERTPEG
jgi:hypothetical protein